MMHTIYSVTHKLHAPSGLIFDDRPYAYEEVPERVETILRAVTAAQIGPALGPDDHGLEPILEVHDAGFIEYLRTVYRESAAYYSAAEPVIAETFATRRGRRVPQRVVFQKGYYAFGVGSPILEGTWEAAYWSAQCALTAASRVLKGERAAYALCRPPGHHAASDLYGGFCYLNNAAIAARYLQAGLGGGWGESPIAILDIDYHHGNGTQEIFYTDPTVLFCSLHAHPDDDYPFFWGAADETGEGDGIGFNHNWPLPEGTSDAGYLSVLDKAIGVIDGCRPRALVISAGFDTAAGDPVGGFDLSRAGFSEIGRRIASLGLPTVIVQEGGYRLETLGENVVAFLQAFAA